MKLEHDTDMKIFGVVIDDWHIRIHILGFHILECTMQNGWYFLGVPLMDG